jgi:heme-degrading monooxygenase HmoA
MAQIVRSHFLWGLLVGLSLAWFGGLVGQALNGIELPPAEAGEGKPAGMFVNLVNFPPVRTGKEADFLEWFRWSNEVYAKHKGFISRSLLKPMDKGTYAAIVEHESKETFMAMHHSQDREEAFKRVEPLFDGRPTPHFYEVVISHGK